jgi:sugar/nucleoside kinase (ribokinase family)
MRTLLFGEALVDLVCEHPVTALAEAKAFVPHLGGAAAAVAVHAARGGADVALAGAAGTDQWGGWVRDQLAAAGVDTELFVLDADVATPLEFVTVDSDGRPSPAVYGDTLPHPARAAAAVARTGDDFLAAVDGAAALVLSSGALVAEESRDLAFALRERAQASDRPVVFHADVDLGRWRSASAVMEVAVPALRNALLVSCDADEALRLTAERDVEAAAGWLLAAGARHVVVFLGEDGAMLRGGGLRLDVPGVGAEPVDLTGAGAAVTGVLLARLAVTGYYPPAIAAALPEAVRAAARATEHWGALRR